jgi:pimeloyl-ACP methyl ester carboxylesterase
MSQLRIVVASIALLLLLALAVSVERGHGGLKGLDFELPGRVPATLYFPDDLLRTSPYVIPPVPEKIPGVVLVHGYSGDRIMMAKLARTLAKSGYAVVTPELRGHGNNRTAFRDGWGPPDHLVSDVGAAVVFLQQTKIVDNDRIVVMGHSLGAMAALAYGSHVADVEGLVLIAGSWELLGPERPRNTLFVHAERELEGALASAKSLSAKLAGVEKTESGVTYGDFRSGLAVRRVEVAGTNHGTVLGSQVALDEMIAWLDKLTGYPARTERPEFPEPPFGSGFAWLLFILILPGLGEVMARLAPTTESGANNTSRWGLAMFGLALIGVLPLVILSPPGVLMGLSDADTNVTHIALSGWVLLASLILIGRVTQVPDRSTLSLLVSATSVIFLFLLLGTVIAGLHGVGLTPEKAFLTIWGALCLLPFAWSFQLIFQHERWGRGLLLRLLGRVLIVVSISMGNAFGIFDFAGVISLGMCVIAYVMIEIVLAAYYATSRNVIAGAGFEALTVAWLLAVILPANL